MHPIFLLSKMTDNSFGKLFSFTSFGESHGNAIGCVVDGAPPNLLLNEGLIQPYLDRRRPGPSKFVTQRQEDDEVKILSGVYSWNVKNLLRWISFKNQYEVRIS